MSGPSILLLQRYLSLPALSLSHPSKLTFILDRLLTFEYRFRLPWANPGNTSLAISRVHAARIAYPPLGPAITQTSGVWSQPVKQQSRDDLHRSTRLLPSLDDETDQRSRAGAYSSFSSATSLAIQRSSVHRDTLWERLLDPSTSSSHSPGHHLVAH